MQVLGQPKALSFLVQLVRTQRVPGALLFYGPDGVGKKLTALEFAKALNCTHVQPDGSPCGTCASCRAVDKGIHPDVTLVDYAYQARLEMKKDASSQSYEGDLEKEIAKQQHINVGTIRVVTAKSQQKQVQDGWKVFILDEAQSMQAAAANALLKFIEEPPAKTVWILISSKRSSMLRTILSRCQPLAFGPLAEKDILQIIAQNGLSLSQPQLAARYSGGSVSGALAADEAVALLEEGNFATPAGSMAVVSSLSRVTVTARQEAQTILDVLIRALHRKWTEETVSSRSHKIRPLLKRFETYKRSIARNVSPSLVLETALMSLDGLDLSL
jgi:DNA polymerase-3 subunit delta'